MATGSVSTPAISEEYPWPECSPNYDNLVTEDDTPVDSIYAERQHWLLTNPLIDSWNGPGDGCPCFIATDVGLFNTESGPAFAPDVLVRLGVTPPQTDLSRKENRSYYVWKYGRPDALIEVVSNTEGGELTKKLEGYARIGANYYVVWDPFQFLGDQKLHCFSLKASKFVPCEPWFPELELGVKTWDGVYGCMPANFLRWCDRQGKLIPTGAERAEQEKQRAEQEKQRAEQEKQRAEQEKQRAEQEKQRAEQEKQRAEQEKQRADRLAEKLRAAGIDPDKP